MTADGALRIVHICPRFPPAPGGAELFFDKISRALVARGDAVQVWTTNARSVQAFSSGRGATLPSGRTHVDGLEIRRHRIAHLPLRRLVLTALNQLPFGDGWRASTQRWTPVVPSLILDALRATGPIDVVHGASLPYSAFLFASVRLARRAGARLVLTPFAHFGTGAIRDDPIRRVYLSPLNVRLMREADRVFVQTEEERAVLIGAGLVAERLRLIGMGVEIAECTGGVRDRGRQRWGISSDEIVVGHLANKSTDKGTLDLLEAALQAWREGARFRLLLAGQEMSSFRDRWAAFPAKDRVINLGELSADEKRDFFQAIDLFVLPSYVESFGISFLEAGANRLPIIAYRVAGPAEFLVHGESAWLVAPHDVEDLGRLIAAVCGDAAERRRVGEGASRVAAARPWKLTIARVLDAYDSVADRPRRAVTS